MLSRGTNKILPTFFATRSYHRPINVIRTPQTQHALTKYRSLYPEVSTEQLAVFEKYCATKPTQMCDQQYPAPCALPMINNIMELLKPQNNDYVSSYKIWKEIDLDTKKSCFLNILYEIYQAEEYLSLETHADLLDLINKVKMADSQEQLIRLYIDAPLNAHTPTWVAIKKSNSVYMLGFVLRNKSDDIKELLHFVCFHKPQLLQSARVNELVDNIFFDNLKEKMRNFARSNHPDSNLLSDLEKATTMYDLRKSFELHYQDNPRICWREAKHLLLKDKFAENKPFALSLN